MQSKMERLYTAKTRLGADCGSYHQLLIAKFRLKMKKVGKPLDRSGIKSFTITQWRQQINLIY